jgi:hypothetical protein
LFLILSVDVQAWLRSLRLHKYGHAFIGLDWKQVVRMSDQDMVDAGVNTIGARRKLLKVFENVQRHCIENVSISSILILTQALIFFFLSIYSLLNINLPLCSLFILFY